MPGFSAAGCFGLTLHAGGMPCLGVAFVEDMLTVLNADSSDGGDEETEGDTECDPGLVDVDMAGADPPTEVRARHGRRRRGRRRRPWQGQGWVGGWGAGGRAGTRGYVFWCPRSD